MAITTYPYSGVHDCVTGSCTDAYDFVISDDRVMSSADGTVTERRANVPSDTCDPNDHLGNVVKARVRTPTEPDPSKTIILFYAHLDRVFAPPQGFSFLQGEAVGKQGITGYTQGSDWGWNGSSWGYHCGEHLHFEFYPSSQSDPQRPDKIDGQATKPLVEAAKSTNSGIGEKLDGTTEYEIRWRYLVLGGWDGFDPLDPADDMGWTNNPNRPGLPTPEALYVHDYRVWGSEQNFRHHPDAFGGERTGMYVPVWDTTWARLVASTFWDTWEAGAPLGSTTVSISVPVKEQSTCPYGSRPDCVAYQLTHLGYIWMGSFGFTEAVWCPDIAGTPFVHAKDGACLHQRCRGAAIPLRSQPG